MPDATGRVLVMQVTTTGAISGQINYQVFPLGVGADQVQVSVEFDGAGTFGLGGGGNACGCTDATAINYDETAQYDDGSCEFEVLGCTDEMACNYDMNANTEWEHLVVDLARDRTRGGHLHHEHTTRCVRQAVGRRVQHVP